MSGPAIPILIGLNAGVTVGAIALVMQYRDQLVRDGIPLTGPFGISVPIKPTISPNNDVLVTAGVIALVVAITVAIIAR